MPAPSRPSFWLASSAFAWLGALLFFLLPPAPAAGASIPVRDLQSEYIVESWQTERGLPDNFINDLAQTPDGYIWIATFNGLARFNGVEFVTLDTANTPQLPSNRIIRFNLDSKGRLWIWSESGPLACRSDGQFRHFSPADGLPENVNLLRENARGEIFVTAEPDGTNSFRLEGDRFIPYHDSEGFCAQLGLVSDVQGRGWTISSNTLRCVDPANRVVSAIPGFAPGGWRLVPAHAGGMYVIANRFQRFFHGAWTDFGPIPIKTDLFASHIEDREGNLWVGTDEGELWRVSARGEFQRFKIQGASSSQLGRGLLQDAEGNLWIGTGGSGLYRFKPRVFRSYGARDGLASDVVRSVAQDHAGNMWFATVNRVDRLAAAEPNRAQPQDARIILPWEVLGARDGAVWVATYAEGVVRLPANEGTPVRFTNSSSIDPPINVLFEQKDGVMDFGSTAGLLQIQNGALVPCADRPPGLATLDVRALAEDSAGHLYLGLESDGLLIKNAKIWNHLTSRDGLADDHVRALYVDRDDAVWIGTEARGLSRFKAGRIFNFTPDASALDLPHTITAIIEDDQGCLWLASNRGLFRAKRQQLNGIADGVGDTADVFHYDRADGMGSSQCTGDHQPAAWKSRDGKLWFATMGGVVVADPSALPFNARPPPVVIERVLVDNSTRPLLPGRLGQLQVPAGSSRLEFQFTALSFSAPERVHFRYRLDGVDKEWIDAGNHRVADYTRAPPGLYQFHVVAANNDNVWNLQGASIAVRILPLYWQTLWFQLAAVLAAGGCVLWFYHLRIRRLHAQRVMQEDFSRRLIQSQESERKRMAAELHDGLGQSLLVVNNHAALALKEAESADKTRARLSKICESASACIEEVRSIARSLRPYQLDRFGLTKTLEDVADLLSHSTGLEVTTEIDPVDGLFSPEAEISIYRVAQEALNNVIKHAHATRARLVVRREPGGVRLILEDNGVGFDYPAVMARDGGRKSFGLVNLRERVRLLNGVVTIETPATGGTRLSAEFPDGILHNGSHR